VQYRTPDLAGFWGAVQWAPDENVNDEFTGFGGGYAKGPLTLGLSYESNKQRVGGDRVNKSWSFGGNFDFKFARLLVNYQMVDDLAISPNGHAGGQLTNLVIGQGPRTITATEQSGYAVGAEIPFGAATFGLMYTEMEYEGTPSAAGLPSSYTLGKFALGVSYAMSRRSFLYAAASLASGDLSDYISQEGVYQVGVQHRF
jgi:predicted porin